MGRNTGFGNIMHLTGADLHFNPLAVAARNGGVNRAISVGLGLADVILEPARNRTPALMDDPQCPVAVLFVPGNDAEPIDIGETRERLLFLLHLAPNGIRLLGASEDLRFDTGLGKLGAHIARYVLDHIAGFALQRDEAADD